MKTLILGAGLSGITAGTILKCPIIEKESYAGGLCSSIRKEKFVFDKTGHYMHIPSEIEDTVFKLIDINSLNKIKKKSGIAINDKIIDYPFQSNFHEAGREIKEECIEEFINRPMDIKVKSFYDWIIKYYGGGIGKHFMIPYNEKLWQYDLKDMTTDWLGEFIPHFTDSDIIKGSKEKNSYNDYFYYPKEGGFGNILNTFDLSGIQFNNDINSIDLKNKSLCTANRCFNYDILLSTIPLKKLIKLINGFENQLEYTSVYNINLGIRGSCPTDKHWLYFPEKDIPFYRVGIPSNVNNNMAPGYHYLLSIEISYREKKTINFDGIINSLCKYNLINSEDDIVIREDFDIEYAYAIYNRIRMDTVNKYLSYLKDNDIHCTGRYGNWHYGFVANDIAGAVKKAKELV